MTVELEALSPSMQFDLTGRTAIVTGGAGTLGEAFCRSTAAAGANVVCVDVDPAGVERVHSDLTAAGARALGLVADVSRPGEARRIVEASVDAFGGVDILVNNAAVHVRVSALDTTEAQLDEVLAVNVKGVLFASQQAAVHMKSLGTGGVIVNLTSEVIDDSGADILPYAISKASVRQMTRAFATQLAPFGIRVNSLSPSWIPSGISLARFTDADGVVDEAALEARVAELTARYPLGRIGTPTDIANALIYLVSDASSYVTGQVVRINGGVFMPW